MLINFFHFLGGRLFEVGAKLNKYGNKVLVSYISQGKVQEFSG